MTRKLLTAFFIFIMASTVYAADDLKSAFKEGELYGEFRNYYYVRDFDQRNEREDIASGGMLYYRTAPLHGVNAGVAFYTGQEMGVNDSDQDVYGLLARDGNGNHDSFSMLGEAFIQGQFGNTTIKLGRQELSTPYVNTDDNRLTPQSTESYVVINKDIPGVEIFAAYVKKMRGKTDTEFVSMTEYAGVGPDDEPVILGGLTYYRIENLTLQVWDFYVREFFNEVYLKAEYGWNISENFSAFGVIQYLTQDDVGDKIGGALDTYTYGMELGVEGCGFGFSLGYADVGDQEILIPWGHDTIVSIQINDNVRAEERGIMAKASYDFGKINIDGLVGKIKYIDFDTPDSGINASPDQTELDFDVKYKFGGCLDGLSLRLRHAIIDQEEDMGGEDFTDSRVMFKYDFSL
ncbi:MAG: OprD family porin [Pirellulales bacterium]|nr:OprD family porin [Pirellulales bacterium]